MRRNQKVLGMAIVGIYTTIVAILLVLAIYGIFEIILNRIQ